MDEADQPGPPDQDTRKTRRPLDRLQEVPQRLHETVREGLRSEGARSGAGAMTDRAAELVRLNAAGHRLHAEDLRLRAARELGVHDRAARAHWLAALLAHREELRRFRGEGEGES